AVRTGRGARRDGRVDGGRVPIARIRGVRRRDVASRLVGEADEETDEAGLPGLRSVIEEDGAELSRAARGRRRERGLAAVARAVAAADDHVRRGITTGQR